MSGPIDLRPNRTALELRLVDPLTDRDWDKSIADHQDSTIFHTSAWAKVLVESYSHRPCYVRVCAEEQPVALIPIMEVRSVFTKSRGVSLPFSDLCAPLLFTSLGQELVIHKLHQLARERSWNYFELRAGTLLPDQAPASESYFAHTLDLRGGSEPVASRFSSAAQRCIRKAQRSGVIATVRRTPDAMEQFYKLHAHTRRKHGVPPQPRSFFQNIQRYLIDAGLGFIVVAELQHRPIAAAVFLKLRGHAVFKFGASDERLQEFRGNNLVMSTAIKFLADSGVETLHFGRTEKQNEGLRRFKLSWGTDEQEIRYGKFDMISKKWSEPASRGAFHQRIFRRLPLSLNRLAGAIVYPHLD